MPRVEQAEIFVCTPGRLLPPTDGSTNAAFRPSDNQTVLQPGTWSAFKMGIVRQPSSPATHQLSNPAYPDSPPT